MTSRKHANNVSTTLASGITNVATSLTVTSATGIPSISAGETVRVTITDGTDYEIAELTESASSPTYNSVNRGMEGTSAVAWSSGAAVIIMGTADSFDRKWDKAETSASGLGILDTDGTLTANSDTKVPSQKAVKTYADSIQGFKTISVSGQSDVVADSATDTLTIAAGSNITLTTDAGTDTLTIAASGGGGGGGQDAYTTTVTSATTTTLTVSSNYQQFFTGSTLGQVVQMPVTSTLTLGYSWIIVNDSSVFITINSSGSNEILKLQAGSAVIVTCTLTSGTTAASWSYQYAGKLGGVFYPMQTVTGNTTLTASSPYITYYSDSGTVNNTMPVAARLVNGQSWVWVNNKSSGDLNIYASDNATLLLTIPVGYKAEFVCKDNTGGTGAGPWVWDLRPISLAGFTGTGNSVRATSPTLVTPALGTPASGVLTNCTATGGVRSFQIFTSGSGATYTKPANVTSILVEGVGGGGGSGGSVGGGSTYCAAGGGGSGGYFRLYIASAASSYTYTVGSGGTAGSSGGGNGGAGGTTSFGASAQATGGAGGQGASVGVVVSSTAFYKGGDAGAGSSASINGGGSPGLPGLTVLGNLISGAGGSSVFGGGAPGSNVIGAGVAATGYGSGASGAVSTTSNAAGAAGSAGIIIVWEFS